MISENQTLAVSALISICNHVIDYTEQYFTKNTIKYAVGKKFFSESQNILQPNGIYFPRCLKELIKADKLRSVIERTYPLSEVAAAHGDIERGRVVGKLMMTVTDSVDGQK